MKKITSHTLIHALSLSNAVAYFLQTFAFSTATPRFVYSLILSFPATSIKKFICMYVYISRVFYNGDVRYVVLDWSVLNVKGCSEG